MTQTSIKNVVLDMTKLSSSEQEEYAKTFCEGSQDLEELLKYLWSNGINTFASCAGHEQQKYADGTTAENYPYILFDTSSFSEQELQNLLRKLIGLNELRDKKYLSFQLDAKQSNRYDRHVGFVGPDEYDRHALTIRFQDKQRANFKELLKVIESVKNYDNSLLSKLKSKFTERKKAANGFKDFVEVASQLNQTQLSQSAHEVKYGMVRLSYSADGLEQAQRELRPDRTQVLDYVNSLLEREIIEVAPGYATPLKDGKYVTNCGGIVELEPNQIEGLKLFVAGKHDAYGKFDKQAMTKLLNDINHSVDNKNTL